MQFYVETPVARIVMIAKDVDQQQGPFTSAGDRKEAIKCACARLRVPYDSLLINTALDRIDGEARRKATNRWPPRGSA